MPGAIKLIYKYEEGKVRPNRVEFSIKMTSPSRSTFWYSIFPTTLSTRSLSISISSQFLLPLRYLLRAKICTSFQIDSLCSSSTASFARSSRPAPRSCRRSFHHLPAKCTPGNGCSVCQADQLTCKVGLHVFLV